MLIVMGGGGGLMDKTHIAKTNTIIEMEYFLENTLILKNNESELEVRATGVATGCIGTGVTTGATGVATGVPIGVATGVATGISGGDGMVKTLPVN
jgi:hypothetical protein